MRRSSSAGSAWKIAAHLAYGDAAGNRWRRVMLPACSAVSVLAMMLLLGLAGMAERIEERQHARSPVAAHDDLDARIRVLPVLDSIRGDQFSVFSMVPLEADAPLPPGLERWPEPGEYAVSPGLQRAMDRNPGLRSRYPGTTRIGDAGITDGEEKLAYGVPADGTLPADRSFTVSGFGRQDGPGITDRNGGNSLRLGAFIFIGVPVLLLMWSGAVTSSPVRDRRVKTLHWIGASRVFLGSVAALEAVFLVVPGVAAAALAWAIAHRRVSYLPFAAVRPLRGDLAVGILPMMLVAAGVIAVIAGYSFLRTWNVPAGSGGPRPVPARRLPFLGFVPLVLGLATLAWGAVSPEATRSPFYSLASAAFLAIGVPATLPFLARYVGRAIADGSRSVLAMLAGRSVESDPTGYVGPIIGLGVFVFLALLGTSITVANQEGELVRALEPELAAARVLYVDTGGSSEADMARRLPGMVVAPIDRSTLGIVATCDEMDTLFGAGATCGPDGVLTADVQGRLAAMLGFPPGPLPFHLIDGIGPTGGATPELLVIGQADDSFEDVVKAAAFSELLPLQTQTIDDLGVRASPLWKWIQSGLAISGLLILLALFAAAIDRIIQSRSGSQRLLALGVGQSMLRRLELSRFALVYLVVVGAMYITGFANAWLVMRTAPDIPFPLASALWVFAMQLGILAAGVVALWSTHRRDTNEVMVRAD